MNIETINRKIRELGKAEKITKQILTELSRTILAYVYNTGDVTPTNRLLSVLTPMNKRTAVIYFKNFLAWKYDAELKTFTTKNKKAFDDKQKATEMFLLDDDNNIFTWAADNIKMEQKEIDWVAKLKTDMTKAFEAGMTADQVLSILEEITTSDELKEAA